MPPTRSMRPGGPSSRNTASSSMAPGMPAQIHVEPWKVNMDPATAMTGVVRTAMGLIRHMMLLASMTVTVVGRSAMAEPRRIAVAALMRGAVAAGMSLAGVIMLGVSVARLMAAALMMRVTSERGAGHHGKCGSAGEEDGNSFHCGLSLSEGLLSGPRSPTMVRKEYSFSLSIF